MSKNPKVVFKSSDGSEHADEETARRHNELLEAKEQFDKAVHNLQWRLSDNAKTADGEWFKFGYQDYWYITELIDRMPRMVQINVYQHSSKVELEECNGGSHLVVYFRHRDVNGELMSMPVSRLYYHKSNAIAAHIAACEKHLEYTREEVERVKRDHSRGRY